MCSVISFADGLTGTARADERDPRRDSSSPGVHFAMKPVGLANLSAELIITQPCRIRKGELENFLLPLILLLKELHLIMDGLLLVAVESTKYFNQLTLIFVQFHWKFGLIA